MRPRADAARARSERVPGSLPLTAACPAPATVPGSAAPPPDPEVRKAADKLAEFVAKNGRSLEEMTRQKNPGNTVFK